MQFEEFFEVIKDPVGKGVGISGEQKISKKFLLMFLFGSYYRSEDLAG